jgi:hypothetical protein
MDTETNIMVVYLGILYVENCLPQVHVYSSADARVSRGELLLAKEDARRGRSCRLDSVPNNDFQDEN